MWSHLNQDKEKEEVSKQEEDYREYLRRTSQEMTKGWENSIENTRIRKGMERDAIKANAVVQGMNLSKALIACGFLFMSKTFFDR